MADTRREVRKNTGDQTGRDGKCVEAVFHIMPKISCLKSDGPYRRSLFEVFVGWTLLGIAPQATWPGAISTADTVQVR